MPVAPENLRPETIDPQPDQAPVSEPPEISTGEQLWRDSWAQAIGIAEVAGPQIATEYAWRVATTKPGRRKENADGSGEFQLPTPEELHPDTLVSGIVYRRPDFRSLRAWGRWETWRALMPHRIAESVDPKDGGTSGWTILSRQVERPEGAAAPGEDAKPAPAATETLSIEDDDTANAAKEPEHDPTKNRQNVVLTADGRLLLIQAPDDTRFDGVMRFSRPHPREGLSKKKLEREKGLLEGHLERNQEVPPRFNVLRRKDAKPSYTSRVGMKIGVISMKRLVDSSIDLGTNPELTAADVLDGLDQFVYERRINLKLPE